MTRIEHTLAGRTYALAQRDGVLAIEITPAADLTPSDMLDLIVPLADLIGPAPGNQRQDATDAGCLNACDPACAPIRAACVPGSDADVAYRGLSGC